MKKLPERIQISGPSGVGKTTIAKWLEEDKNYPFISGSMSDLLPNTKDEHHADMLKHDPNDLYLQDFQLLNLRKKLYHNTAHYVSDRSFLDSAAYFLYKQSDKIPQCEVEHFLELCKMCLCLYCDELIVFNFTPYLVKEWIIEDNHKRILNKFFQAEISSIMGFILDYLGVNFQPRETFIDKGLFHTRYDLHHGGFRCGNLRTIYGNTHITVIDEPSLEARKMIINCILS